MLDFNDKYFENLALEIKKNLDSCTSSSNLMGNSQHLGSIKKIELLLELLEPEDVEKYFFKQLYKNKAQIKEREYMSANFFHSQMNKGTEALSYVTEYTLACLITHITYSCKDFSIIYKLFDKLPNVEVKKSVLLKYMNDFLSQISSQNAKNIYYFYTTMLSIIEEQNIYCTIADYSENNFFSRLYSPLAQDIGNLGSFSIRQVLDKSDKEHIFELYVQHRLNSSRSLLKDNYLAMIKDWLEKNEVDYNYFFKNRFSYYSPYGRELLKDELFSKAFSQYTKTLSLGSERLTCDLFILSHFNPHEHNIGNVGLSNILFSEDQFHAVLANNGFKTAYNCRKFSFTFTLEHYKKILTSGQDWLDEQFIQVLLTDLQKIPDGYKIATDILLLNGSSHLVSHFDWLKSSLEKIKLEQNLQAAHTCNTSFKL